MKKEMIDIRITDCTERVVLIPPYVRVYRRKHSSELADLLKLIDYHIILILVIPNYLLHARVCTVVLLCPSHSSPAMHSVVCGVLYSYVRTYT